MPRCTRRRPGPVIQEREACTFAIRPAARCWRHLVEEIADLDTPIAELIARAAPDLLHHLGVGPALLISAGGNPERLSLAAGWPDPGRSWRRCRCSPTAGAGAGRGSGDLGPGDLRGLSDHVGLGDHRIRVRVRGHRRSRGGGGRRRCRGAAVDPDEQAVGSTGAVIGTPRGRPHSDPAADRWRVASRSSVGPVSVGWSVGRVAGRRRGSIGAS